MPIKLIPNFPIKQFVTPETNKNCDLNQKFHNFPKEGNNCNDNFSSTTYSFVPIVFFVIHTIFFYFTEYSKKIQ